LLAANFAAMPTQLELNSIALCLRIFSPFLWKYIVYFDTSIPALKLVTDKAAIRRWMVFDTIFLFLGFLICQLLIGLTKILHSNLLPNYRLIDAVVAAFCILAGGCVVTLELAFHFFRFEACSGLRHLIKEERNIRFAGGKSLIQSIQLYVSL
jgi:uncharacterized membrane-anchored protein